MTSDSTTTDSGAESTKTSSGFSGEGSGDTESDSEATTTVTATAERTDVDVGSLTGEVSPDRAEKVSRLASALTERLDERNEILDDEPTETVDASLRPDLDVSEGTIEVFSEDADEDRVQRFHDLDTEIARLLLDNQQLVIETVDEYAQSE